MLALVATLSPRSARATTIEFGTNGLGNLSTITFVDGLSLQFLNAGSYNTPFFLVFEGLYSNIGGESSVASGVPPTINVDGNPRTIDQVAKGSLSAIWQGDELLVRFGNGEGAVLGVSAGDLISVLAGTVVTLDTPVLFPENLGSPFDVYAADQPSFGDPMTVITGTVQAVPEPGTAALAVLGAVALLAAWRRRSA